MKTEVHTKLYMCVPSSIIHNSQKGDPNVYQLMVGRYIHTMGYDSGVKRDEVLYMLCSMDSTWKPCVRWKKPGIRGLICRTGNTIETEASGLSGSRRCSWRTFIFSLLFLPPFLLSSFPHFVPFPPSISFPPLLSSLPPVSPPFSFPLLPQFFLSSTS